MKKKFKNFLGSRTFFTACFKWNMSTLLYHFQRKNVMTLEEGKEINLG